MTRDVKVLRSLVGLGLGLCLSIKSILVSASVSYVLVLSYQIDGVFLKRSDFWLFC